jgi:hypothetical protein
MKKISVFVLSVVLLLLVSLFMTGCSCNKKIFDFNYTYNSCFIKEGDVWVYYEIESWDDYDDGTVTIWTTDGQMIFTHSTNVILCGEV